MANRLLTLARSDADVNHIRSIQSATQASAMEPLVESVRLTLFRLFFAAGIVAGAPAFAGPSSAQSASVGNPWAAPSEARSAKFDENGELEAIDPDQLPISGGVSTPSSGHSSGWNSGVKARSVLDGLGPIPLPRPVNSMISGIAPTSPRSPEKAKDVYDANGGASCCEIDSTGSSTNSAVPTLNSRVTGQEHHEIAAA